MSQIAHHSISHCSTTPSLPLPYLHVPIKHLRKLELQRNFPLVQRHPLIVHHLLQIGRVIVHLPVHHVRCRISSHDHFNRVPSFVLVHRVSNHPPDTIRHPLHQRHPAFFHVQKHRC